MKTRLHILFPGIAIAAMLPLLGGCYTQLETMDSAYDENQAAEDTVLAEAEGVEEDFDRDYPPPDYYLTFSYYHPGFTVLYSPYDPWDYWYYPGPVWYSPWYPPYYPVYSCWPYYPYGYYPYYHPVVYYGNGGHGGGYYPGSGGGSQTRDFGNSRGFGDPTGTRARGGTVRRTGGTDEDGGPVTALPVSISRPTRQGGATVSGGTGTKTDSPQRKAAVNRPPTRKVQSASTPANRGSSGTSRGGSDRGSVSSPPRSSSPPPPANSGSRGSSGGSRSGSPRSR
jgi:hypothetical protein